MSTRFNNKYPSSSASKSYNSKRYSEAQSPRQQDLVKWLDEYMAQKKRKVVEYPDEHSATNLTIKALKKVHSRMKPAEAKSNSRIQQKSHANIEKSDNHISLSVTGQNNELLKA